MNTNTNGYQNQIPNKIFRYIQICHSFIKTNFKHINALCYKIVFKLLNTNVN